MALLNKPARSLFVGLSSLILGIAAPLLILQEAPRSALQSLSGIVIVLVGILMIFRLAAPQRDATAPREAAAGTMMILLGCGILSSQWGVRLSFLAGGLLMLACTHLRLSDRWLNASD
ncbi:MAG: hypothetical protein ABI895_20750 [Deltaproteobacteria bacterium]